MSEQARWDERYRSRAASGAPSATVTALLPWLPPRGRALDLAGGAGRHARWLADRGLDVTLLDISPEGLRLAREAGFVGSTCCVDLEREPVPEGPWDLVLVAWFLDRQVLRQIPAVLAPGGRVVVVHPTRRNLERHAHPSARWLLEEGELPGLVPGLRVLHHVEGWSTEGTHEAVLVAERPAGAPTGAPG